VERLKDAVFVAVHLVPMVAGFLWGICRVGFDAGFEAYFDLTEKL
jgi:hypothetical protein